MGSSVGLISVTNSKQSLKDDILNSLALIDYRWKSNVKSVIIKPNLCYYWNSSTGQTTDPRIVGAIIDVVREKYGEVDIKIAEADASAMRTKHAFPVLGYTQLSEEKHVGLLNLSEDVLEEKTIKINGSQLTFKVPQALLQSDLFINVPKLKLMRQTTITCAMKNLFGCIGTPRKVKYHSLLSEAIVGMNKFLIPHLTIVDGLVALGAHPVKLNLILSGTDAFSVDYIACKVMGYNPYKVKFLNLAKKEGVGDWTGIELRGITDLTPYAKTFPKPGIKSSNWLWKVQFSFIKAYKAVSGDIIPPALEE